MSEKMRRGCVYLPLEDLAKFNHTGAKIFLCVWSMNAMEPRVPNDTAVLCGKEKELATYSDARWPGVGGFIELQPWMELNAINTMCLISVPTRQVCESCEFNLCGFMIAGALRIGLENEFCSRNFNFKNSKFKHRTVQICLL